MALGILLVENCTVTARPAALLLVARACPTRGLTSLAALLRLAHRPNAPPPEKQNVVFSAKNSVKRRTSAKAARRPWRGQGCSIRQDLRRSTAARYSVVLCWRLFNRNLCASARAPLLLHWHEQGPRPWSAVVMARCVRWALLALLP